MASMCVLFRVPVSSSFSRLKLERAVVKERFRACSSERMWETEWWVRTAAAWRKVKCCRQVARKAFKWWSVGGQNARERWESSLNGVASTMAKTAEEEGEVDKAEEIA